MQSRSQEIARDVNALLRARTPLLWVVTREEARVEAHLMEAAKAAGYIPRTWDVAAGVCDMNGAGIRNMGGADLSSTLETIKERANNIYGQVDRGAWILRDAPAWLRDLPGAQPCRALRNLARSLPASPRDRAQALIVLTPDANVPAELAGHATVINWALPDRAEIAAILDAALDSLPDEIKASAAPEGTRDAAIDAAVGLTGEEAQSCFAKSLVTSRAIVPALIASEKRRVIAREKVLEWVEPIAGGIDAVGGLDVLKGWLASRASAYSPAARAYGLPAPKGMLLVGPPGTGKSLSAKAVATAWGVPLLKLDMGALKSKFVGDSEANIRKAFATIEAVGRCVVWLDEIEKALAGATQGGADGGVSSDALGAVLNWMQERKNEAFVIATANAVDSLPPELLRKGRFDQIWWIDLPNATERAEIVKVALASYGRAGVVIDARGIASATEGFTGSEVAELVPDALFAAFGEGQREIVSADLFKAAKGVIPLSKTAADKINALREWANGRAVPASTPVAVDAANRGRIVDL